MRKDPKVGGIAEETCKVTRTDSNAHQVVADYCCCPTRSGSGLMMLPIRSGSGLSWYRPILRGMENKLDPPYFCINQLRFRGIIINYAMTICKIKLNINMSVLGWIKINTDGASHGALGLSGGGGIFRDNGDDLIGCFSTSFGIQNAIFAELYIAILAIGLVFYKGWKVV
ncbi:hypothetical protein Lal_00012303 [Lupinus albus]|nr:hypothetical protein Lal_00012303 [Lupinus albus]